MNKTIYNRIALLFCIIVITGCIFYSCNKEIFLEVTPIEGAYSIKKYDLGEGVHGVRFKIKAVYRSREILNYYDEKLKEKGFFPFIEDYLAEEDRKWPWFISPKEDRKEMLTAHWVNKERTRRIFLVMEIHLKADAPIPWGQYVEYTVTYQENPYFELPPPF